MKMHLHYSVILPIVMLLSFSSIAQDHTRGFGESFYSGKTASIAVVPFTPRMLISDIHRDMCVRNGMTSKEVQAALAEGFCHAMRVARPNRAESFVFGWEDEWPEGLNAVYGELTYIMKPVAPIEGTAISSTSKIDEGELRIRRDTVTRYMSAVIDSTTISAFAVETKSNFVLVITELDIVNLGDPIQVNPKGVELFVRLHYTLFDPNGKEVGGGMVKSPLESNTYEPIQFAREEFIEAASKLYTQISSILNLPIQTEN